tara:strand:- start:133 stop:519 length:387 start_codon:yes stop_codon:yes gene_type:complete
MNRYTITYTATSKDAVDIAEAHQGAREAGLNVLQEIESATGYALDILKVSVAESEAKSEEGLPYTFGETLRLDIINHDAFAFSSGNFGYVEVQYINCSNNGESTTARVHYKGLILNMSPDRLYRPGKE